MIVLLSLALWLSLHPCAAYMTLQDKIPNGHLVPDPCSVSSYWPGVGHQNSSGGGALNVFGAAFKTVGFEWSQVCAADSDGDGRTNGEELGDPRCVWSPGQVPERSTNITHPGVCDPRDSYKCQGQNSFLSCTAYVSNKCAVLSEPGIRNLTLAMKTLTVPQMEVSTLCMTFNLTFDKGYHLAAVEPVVNNNAMFHRAYLYACDEDISTVTAVAQPCGTLKSCGTLVTSWVVGQQTECYGQNFGLVLGATGYKILKMEVHYRNPQLIANTTDNSGLRLYYRPIKDNVTNLAVISTGQKLLDLGPGKDTSQHVGVCPESCTSQLFSKPANIVSVQHKMNYFGQTINVALYRNGSKVQDLSWDKAYNDDCPSKHLLQPHVRILPGDRLVTTCTYNTSGASTWRFYNQPSAEDGCSAYLTLYPREALSSSNKCDAIGSLSACDVTSGTAKIGDCHVSQFTNLTNPETIKMAAELEKSCSLNGFCRPECLEVTSRLLSHPCLRGEASKVVQYLLQQKTAGLMFVGRLHSCPMACTCTDVCPSQVDNIGNNFNDTDHNHTMHSNGIEGGEFGKNGAIVVMSDFILLLVFLFTFIFQC